MLVLLQFPAALLSGRFPPALTAQRLTLRQSKPARFLSEAVA